MADAIPLRRREDRVAGAVRRVEAGEEINIRPGSTPVARLGEERAGRIAPPGALRGRIHILDDFDGPLPEFDAYRDA